MPISIPNANPSQSRLDSVWAKFIKRTTSKPIYTGACDPVCVVSTSSSILQTNIFCLAVLGAIVFEPLVDYASPIYANFFIYGLGMEQRWLGICNRRTHVWARNWCWTFFHSRIHVLSSSKPRTRSCDKDHIFNRSVVDSTHQSFPVQHLDIYILHTCQDIASFMSLESVGSACF